MSELNKTTEAECPGTISIIQSIIEEIHPCYVNEDGNIIVSANCKTEFLDVIETSVYCDYCGSKLGSDEYKKHGIATGWEMV